MDCLEEMDNLVLLDQEDFLDQRFFLFFSFLSVVDYRYRIRVNQDHHEDIIISKQQLHHHSELQNQCAIVLPDHLVDLVLMVLLVCLAHQEKTVKMDYLVLQD